MKFYIDRTSSPCEGATLANPGYTAVPHVRPLYCIEINTLDELIALRDKVKSPIILSGPVQEDPGTLYSLEIYDDYRE